MDIFETVERAFPGIFLERDFPFSKHTTIGCGGVASVCAAPACAEEARALLAFLEGKGIPYCFLGAGANVLPSDEPFDGVVVRFFRLNALGAERDRVFAGAGVTGGRLLRFTESYGLGGLEFLTGIPMSVGGAAAMNAGVKSRHMSDAVEFVYGIENGVRRVFSASECGYGEKTSVFLGGIAITGVVFKVSPADAGEIGKRKEYYRAKRKGLPMGKSMGCVFVNPDGCSAGAIIDGCGLKGTAFGGAHISRVHANFIINEGGSASDVEALVRFVKKTVYEKTGVRLREEFRRLP